VQINFTGCQLVLYPINKQFSGVTNSYSEIISEPLQRFRLLTEATNLYLEHMTNKIYHNAANAFSCYAHILSAIKNKLENEHSAFLFYSSCA
jgi:hypothetical protein